MRFIIFSVLLLGSLVGCSTVDRTTSGPKKIVQEESRLSVSEGNTNTMKKRLVILPFLDGSDKVFPPDWKEQARLALAKDLNLTGQVMVIQAQDLKINNEEFIKNAEYDLLALSKPANAAGVVAVIEGKILDFKLRKEADKIGVVRSLKITSEAQVQIRMVLARTGREVFNTVKTVTLEEDETRLAERVSEDQKVQRNSQMIGQMMSEAFRDFTPQLLASLDKISWEGRVAAIQGDRIYLNVGRISGLQVGDLLKVSEESEDIYDPETGRHIGRVPGRLKGTLEVVNYFGQDGSIAVIHSGAGFRENDRVELYQ
ncbi:MAG: hypothetical protein ACOYOK_05700 [Pseudobdellovibrionaceae bacterium]